MGPHDDAPAPTPAPAPARWRPVILIVAPLAIALLASACLLWARTTDDGTTGYCTRATEEITALVRRTEGPGRADLNRTSQLEEAFSRAYLIDIDNLLPGAPTALRADLLRAKHLLATYRDERAEAEQAGRPVPAPPKAFQPIMNAFAASYYKDCLGRT